MSDGLTSVVLSIPQGTNPFAFLRGYLYDQVAPKTDDAVFPIFYVVMGIFGLTSFLTLLGFWARWRRQSLWFWKRAALPSGSLIVPHPVNVFAFFSLFYLLASIGQMAAYVVAFKASRQGNLSPYLHVFVAQLAYIPLYCAGCGDMAGSLTSALTARFRQGKCLPRWLSPTIIHSVMFGLPALWIVGSAVCAGLMGAAGTILGDAYGALDAQLATDQAGWVNSTTLPVEQLLELQPLALNVQDKLNDLVALSRALFGLLTALAILLWLLWAPANYWQVRMLLSQIFLLRQTATHEKRLSKEEHAAATLTTSPILSSTRLTHSAKQRRSVSSLEKQAHRLMLQCWTRVISAIGFTCILVVYTFLTADAAKDPTAVFGDPRQGLTFLTAPFWCFVAVGVPILIIFAIRSFDSHAVLGNLTTMDSTTSPATMRERDRRPSLGHVRSKSGELIKVASSQLHVRVDVESQVNVDVEDEKADKEEAEGKGLMLRF